MFVKFDMANEAENCKVICAIIRIPIILMMCMKEIIKIMNKNNIPMILETPIDDRRDDFGNIDKVKSLA